MDKMKILTEERVREIVREEIRIIAIENYKMHRKIDELAKNNEIKANKVKG